MRGNLSLVVDHFRDELQLVREELSQARSVLTDTRRQLERAEDALASSRRRLKHATLMLQGLRQHAL